MCTDLYTLSVRETVRWWSGGWSQNLHRGKNAGSSGDGDVGATDVAASDAGNAGEGGTLMTEDWTTATWVKDLVQAVDEAMSKSTTSGSQADEDDEADDEYDEWFTGDDTFSNTVVAYLEHRLRE